MTSDNDSFVVSVTDELVKAVRPDGKIEQIAWNDIMEIKMVITDAGPFAPDVWLALMGKTSGCVIPQDAEGYYTVYDIVSKYEGFNFENVIASMSCTDNQEFPLWSRA